MTTKRENAGTTSRSVGWAFAPAAGLTVGLSAGAIFAINQFYPRSLIALLAALIALTVAAALIVVGWRGRSWLSDLSLGVGCGGALATVVVGLATAGGAA